MTKAEPLSGTTIIPNDSIMDRQTILDLTNEQVETLLSNIRKRRNAPIQIYEDVLNLARQRQAEIVNRKLAKQATMFGKELASVEKALTKLENRALAIQGFKIQLENIVVENEK